MSKTSFLHSVKVPQLYKVSSKIVKTILVEGGSLKELLYTTVRANLKAAYALITKTIERNADLEIIIKKSKILTDNPRLDPWLAKVLIAELLFGKGALQSDCKPVQTVLSFSDALQAALENCRLNAEENYPAEHEKKPRYVRVNTLRKTCDEVIKAFRSEGWQLVPPLDTYEQFLQAVRHLTEGEFIRDFHLKNVLVFPPRTEFFRHEMYRDGTILLQDKASCLPPHLLNPDPKSTVLDMCAAPGMKTSMLAAMTRGKATIYAMEINSRRFKTLESIVQGAGCEGVTVIEGDSLQLSVEYASWCSDVQFILVDPSCSGTGMTERARLFTHDNDKNGQLRKLTAFQKKLLIHALTKFPAARRVVYSTCSTQEEENEAVVAAVLGYFPAPAPWTVVSVLPDWPSRGSDSYEFGRHCVTASPTRDLTTGFFIAVLERVDGVEIPEFFNEPMKWENSEMNGSSGKKFVKDSKKLKKERRKLRKRVGDGKVSEEEGAIKVCVEEVINGDSRRLIRKKKKKWSKSMKDSDVKVGGTMEECVDGALFNRVDLEEAVREDSDTKKVNERSKRKKVVDLKNSNADVALRNAIEMNDGKLVESTDRVDVDETARNDVNVKTKKKKKRGDGPCTEVVVGEDDIEGSKKVQAKKRRIEKSLEVADENALIDAREDSVQTVRKKKKLN